MAKIPLHIQRVEQASESNLDTSATLLVSLMKDDNGFVSLCGGDPSLHFALARSLVAACALEGEYYTATDEHNELIGFCCWMPPGKEIFSTDAQRERGLNDFMKNLSEEGKDYYKTTYFAEFPTFVAKCLGNPKWKADYWWLHTLMVRQSNQRQGVARALLQPVREKSAKAKEPLALSTTSEKNVAIYEGLGFTLIDSKIVPSPWGDWPLYVFQSKPEEQ